MKEKLLQKKEELKKLEKTLASTRKELNSLGQTLCIYSSSLEKDKKEIKKIELEIVNENKNLSEVKEKVKEELKKIDRKENKSIQTITLEKESLRKTVLVFKDSENNAREEQKKLSEIIQSNEKLLSYINNSIEKNSNLLKEIRIERNSLSGGRQSIAYGVEDNKEESEKLKQKSISLDKRKVYIDSQFIIMSKDKAGLKSQHQVADIKSAANEDTRKNLAEKNIELKKDIEYYKELTNEVEEAKIKNNEKEAGFVEREEKLREQKLELAIKSRELDLLQAKVKKLVRKHRLEEEIKTYG